MLVESRSLGGVLRAMTSEYLCSIAATNGQVGGFLHREVAPILQRNDRVVLYFRDFDLQGHQIEANTRRVLEHKARRRIDWNRIAITEEQIAQRGHVDLEEGPPVYDRAWGSAGIRSMGVRGPRPGHHPTPRPGCLGRPVARTA